MSSKEAQYPCIGIKLSKGKALTNYIEANAAARACFFADISSSTMFPTASIIMAGLFHTVLIHTVSLGNIASDKPVVPFYAAFITGCIRVSVVHKSLGTLFKIG